MAVLISEFSQNDCLNQCLKFGGDFSFLLHFSNKACEREFKKSYYEVNLFIGKKQSQRR